MCLQHVHLMTLMRSRARMIDAHMHNHMQTHTHSSVLLTHTMLTDLMIIKKQRVSWDIFVLLLHDIHPQIIPPPPPPPTHTHTHRHHSPIGWRWVTGVYSAPSSSQHTAAPIHTQTEDWTVTLPMQMIVWSSCLELVVSCQWKDVTKWLVFSISLLGRTHQGSSGKRSTEQVCKNCYC